MAKPKYEYLTLHNLGGGKIYPDKQLVHSFILDRWAEMDCATCYPLTFFNAIRLIFKNELMICFWAFVRFLWKLGFVRTEIGEQFQWKHFTWKFWNNRKVAAD